MGLQSKLFRGDPRLESCLVHNSAHVTPGAVGEYVSKIQQALALLDDSVIASDETASGRYGASTASAVLAYKTARNIINPSYQTQADNIVGKMTIASLDQEMSAFENKPAPDSPAGMIEQSVGAGGVNLRNDVLIIQNALTVLRARRGQCWIALDGWAGPETVAAIEEFQSLNGLSPDGLVEPDGPTLAQLQISLGDEALIFGPTLSEILPILDSLTELARLAPPKGRELFARTVNDLSVLRHYRDLAEGLLRRDSPVSFLRVENLFQQWPRPANPRQVFGNLDGAVIPASAFGSVQARSRFQLNVIGSPIPIPLPPQAVVALLAIFVATLLIAMTQSPEFAKAVAARARELDRILASLRNKEVDAFRAALNLLIEITDDESGKDKRCRDSKTFDPNPDCLEAIANFRFVLERTRKMLREIGERIALLAGGHGRENVNSLLVWIRGMLRRAQQNVVDLQVASQDMAHKCKCPEIL